MFRAGDALAYSPEVPIDSFTYVVGLFLTSQDDFLVLAVPAGASLGSRTYTAKAADNSDVRCQFVEVAATAVRPAESIAVDERQMLRFVKVPAARSLATVYHGLHSSDDSAPASRPRGAFSRTLVPEPAIWSSDPWNLAAQPTEPRPAVGPSSTASAVAWPSSAPPGNEMDALKDMMAKQGQILEMVARRLDSLPAQPRQAAPPQAPTASTPAQAAAAGSSARQVGPVRFDLSPRARPRSWLDVLGEDGETDEEDPREAPPRSRPSSGTAPAAQPSTTRVNQPDSGTSDVERLIALVREIKGSPDSNFEELGMADDRARASGLAGVHRLRKELKAHPSRVTEAYTKDIREKLGAHDDRAFWTFRDWSNKLSGRFSRFRGMWRCHAMASEILQVLVIEKNLELGAALTVPFQKCLMQMALDNGDWTAGMLLWPYPDPLSGEQFGGTEEEMRRVAAYMKAVSDLKQRARPSAADARAGTDEERTPAYEGGTGGKAKGSRRRGTGKGGEATAPEK